MPKVRLAKKNEEEASDLILSDYTAKSFVVTGDTVSHSKELKQLGGSFNPNLKIGAGWIFSKARKESVEKYINTGEVEPFVFDKSQFDKKDDNVIQDIFIQLKEAFNTDEEYEGEEILDAIRQIENKIMGKNIEKKL